jgi:hypothetical protein
MPSKNREDDTISESVLTGYRFVNQEVDYGKGLGLNEWGGIEMGTCSEFLKSSAVVTMRRVLVWVVDNCGMYSILSWWFKIGVIYFKVERGEAFFFVH